MSEDQNTEWKASWRDDYLKWICGFANAQGGVLEIGRNDEGQVIGLEDAARLMEELPNKLRDLLGILADIDLLQEDGKPYLRIAVEPYPVPISYNGVSTIIAAAAPSRCSRGPRSIASFWGRLANGGMRCRCPAWESAIWTDRS
jgi:predicted HTH transcriptional regulator